MVQDYTPERDASLGLVFRLNNLWAQADYYALEGNYDKWNSVLDRIYCNLLYREDMEIKTSKDGELTVDLPKKDTKIYVILSKAIQKEKYFWFKVNKSKKSYYRSRWYHSIQKKDIWLRKEMQKLKLYLKENKKTPGSSLFGDFGKGKK
jgi:hypothetical protein